MKEQLISFETAKLAKDKGFGVDTISAYRDPHDLKEGLYFKEKAHNWNMRETLLKSTDKWCSAPTQSLLQKWLRDVHSIIVESRCFVDEELNQFLWEDVSFNSEMEVSTYTYYNTYEEALEKGLQEALKLI